MTAAGADADPHAASAAAVAYTPRPLATSGVVLSADLTALGERLAAHVHDLWAAGRLAEGWTYGARRDDTARTHPGLIPYGALAESEKAYDRETALGTIRALVALGYRLVPASADGARVDLGPGA